MTLVQIWGLLIALTVGWWMTHIFLFLIVGCLTGGAWIGYSHGYYDGWHKREKPRMPLQYKHRPPQREGH